MQNFQTSTELRSKRQKDQIIINLINHDKRLAGQWNSIAGSNTGDGDVEERLTTSRRVSVVVAQWTDFTVCANEVLNALYGVAKADILEIRHPFHRPKVGLCLSRERITVLLKLRLLGDDRKGELERKETSLMPPDHDTSDSAKDSLILPH